MRRSGLWVGIVLVALVILAALVSLVWTPYDPLQVQPTQILQSAGWRHLLGTDGFGIDILSRLLVGARTTVFVGVVAVSLAAIGGVPLGVLAGMRGGWVSEIVLRVSDGSMGASAARLGTQVLHSDQLQVLLDHLQPPMPKVIRRYCLQRDPVSTRPVHKMTVDNTPPPSTINGYS